ncbi:MAG TPA: SDR family oxidoreductase [Streptosporangiaceae bacterium]|nr:SDR family oxidoreductase [Streptosporangiaceae bacterium]
MRSALLIGASRGVGAHIANRLSEEGWMVKGVGRRPFESVTPRPNFDYVRADISRPNALDQVLGDFGRIPDLVVHNAVHPSEDSSSVGLESMEAAFRVNALVPYLMTRDLLARKPDADFLSCVFINSEAVFHADQHSCSYAASKAALRVLAAGLSASVRNGNAALATLMLGPLADQSRLDEARSIAEKRGITPTQVIKLFLRKTKPDLVIDELIDYESCFMSIKYIYGLGRAANGMVCRLDGGSGGSLI